MDILNTIENLIRKDKMLDRNLPDRRTNVCAFYEATGYQKACDNILMFINSLREIPKFKIGDSIVPKNHREESLVITKIQNGHYYSEDLDICSISEQDLWEVDSLSENDNLSPKTEKQIDELAINVANDIKQQIINNYQAVATFDPDYNLTLKNEINNINDEDENDALDQLLLKLAIDFGYNHMTFNACRDFYRPLIIDAVKDAIFEKEIDLLREKYHGFESLTDNDVVNICKHFYYYGPGTESGTKPLS